MKNHPRSRKNTYVMVCVVSVIAFSFIVFFLFSRGRSRSKPKSKDPKTELPISLQMCAKIYDQADLLDTKVLPIPEEGEWEKKEREKFYKEILPDVNRLNDFNLKDITTRNSLEILHRARNECKRKKVNDYYDKYSSFEIGFWPSVVVWMYKEAKKKVPQKVMDVGAAYGSLSSYSVELMKLNGNENGKVVALDFMKDYFPIGMLLPQHISHHIFNVQTGDYEAASWAVEESFDWIILTEAIEHFLYYPTETLIHLRKLLKPNGKLFLTTRENSKSERSFQKTLKRFPSPADVYPDEHVYEYSAEEIDHLFRESGFIVERIALNGYSGVEYQLTRNKFDWLVKFKRD